jgi:hypothetical protein
MNFMNWIKYRHWLSCAAGLILISAVVGCKRDSNQVYYAPKETAQTPSPQAASPESSDNAMPAGAPQTLPSLTWTLPPGWQEKPASGMRAASFTATGTNNQTADISIIPLPFTGHDLELVNMWRQQVQLPPTTQAAADKSFTPVTIAGDQGKLFEFTSEQPVIEGKFRSGILVAELTRGQMSWFFKLAGEESFVASQKPVLIAFLKSIQFTEQTDALPPGHPALGGQPTVTPHPLESAQTPTENSGKPTWTVPADWQAMSPSEFLLAEYSITGANGSKAEVNVAQLAGEGGGMLPNVNRWRRQLGLPPATEESLPTMATPLPISGSTATVVDLTGTDSKSGKSVRLVGVILPQVGQTWFYKLMGNDQVVAQQKDTFLKFVQSANYANAH